MDGGRFENLYSVRAQDLDGVFPQLRPQLDTDSYVSINGFHRPGSGVSRHSPEGLALPVAHRSGGALRWLTAVFADLDCHTLGLTFGQTFGMVIDAQDSGIIPPVTMFQRSGRGLWCYWFLRDRHDDATPKDWPAAGPVRAWPEKVELWATTQRMIGERLAQMGADANARDTARVSRVPGSINSKAGLRVGYLLQADDAGQPFVYTLNDLAQAVGARVPPMAAGVRAIDAQLSAAGRLGAAARWRHERDRFRILASLRPSWPVGLRSKATWVYATLLTALRPGDRPAADAIAEELENLWATFDQPDDDRYTLDDVRATLNGVLAEAASNQRRRGRGRPIRMQTIADRLEVTPEEAAICGYPPARQFSRLPNLEPRTRAELAQRRQDALRAILAARGGAMPTLRDLVDMLLDQGLPTCAETVRTDLEAIGVTNPRALPGRRRRCARRPSPKLFPE
jgi:hypothetical protein